MKHLRHPFLSSIASLLLLAPASAAPGDLDATFNAPNGTVVTDLGGYEHGNAVTVLSDGKILVAGDGDGDFLLARYNDDGTLDTTFNALGTTPGIVTTDLQSSSFDQAYGLAVQTDGKIVVVGSTDIAGVSDFGVVRYNSDGTIDTSFGTDGVVLTDFGQEGESAKGVAIQSDGKIVVAGYSGEMSSGSSNQKFAVVRYTSAGALDTGFSGDGKDLQDITVGDADMATCVVIQANQKIVVGGTTGDRFAAIRYTTAGALDTSFSSDGKAIGGVGFANAILLQDDLASADDKVLLGGYTFDADDDIMLTRFTPTGGLDTGFGVGGTVTTDLGASEQINGMALDPNGKVVFAGRSFDMLTTFVGNFLLGRLNTDGSLDTGFGAGGSVTTDAGGVANDNSALGIAIHDGKILLVGYSYNTVDFDISLARYEGGEPPPAPEIAVYEGINTSIDTEVQSGDTLKIQAARVGLTSRTATITISNKGNLSLTGLSASLAGGSEFTLTQPLATSLSAGQSTTLTVSLSPTTGGAQTDTLTILSDDADEGTFQLNIRSIVPTATSDSFADRIDLGNASTVDVAGTNAGATHEPAEPALGVETSASVWYKWMAPSSGWVTINTLGSSIDTVIALSTGSALGSINRLGYNDSTHSYSDRDEPGFSWGVSRLTFYATAGTSYNISVSSYGDSPLDTGLFELHIAPANPTIRVMGITSASTNVTSANNTATSDVTIESDDPLDAFFANLDFTYINSNDFRSSGTSFSEAALTSGTSTNGVYSVILPIGKASPPGSWALSVWIDGTNWSAPGGDSLEDDFLIPGASGSLTVTNTGAVDNAAPTLVAVAGVPASTNVTIDPSNFTVDVTVSEPLSGLKFGRISAVIGGSNFLSLAEFDASTPSTTSGANTIYHVAAEVPQGWPAGVYYVNIDLEDKALNYKTYSDDPAQKDWATPIPPTTSQLKFTIVNTNGIAPDIAVKQPDGTNLTDNVGNVAFGTVERGESVSRRFIIKNTGDKLLTGLAVTKAGANPADFEVEALYSTVVDPGGMGETEFTVTFRPGAAGTRSAILRIASNDPDENPFDINVTGFSPTGPEIAVEQPLNTPLEAGLATIGYGNTPTNMPATKTFTIRNLGSTPLTTTATLLGADASSFVLTATPPASVPANGTTTIGVQFAPLTTGAKTAFLRIANNDANEAPFDIELTGVATPSAGSFRFSQALYTVNESAGTVTVMVERVGGTFGEIKARVATVNGTATAPSDFTALPAGTEVTFADGDAVSKPVVITLLNNTTPVEPNETFTVALSNPNNNSTLGTPATCNVRILDSGADAAIPVVTITSPAAAANVLESAGSTVTITGTATDDKGVADVQVSLNGGGFTSATIPTAVQQGASVTYTKVVTPVPGLNTIAVKSIDTATKQSTVVTRSFTFVVMRNLAVNILPVGTGTVTAGYVSSSSRQLEKAYNIVATPSAGNVFAGWTTGPGGPSLADIGVTGTASEVPNLTFTMKEGLVLNANFVSNPFTAVKGSYNGLVRHSGTLPAPNGTTPSNSTEGFINVTLQPTGAFTAKLLIDGLTLSAGGVLDNSGTARFGTSRATTVAVARPGKPSVALQFSVDLTPLPGGTGKLTGTVVQNYRTVITAVSDFSADLAITTGIDSNYLGTAGATATYTAFIEPQPLLDQPSGLTEDDYAQGYSNAIITVSKTGVVTFTGNLADGTLNVTASSTLSKGFKSPIFIQLYNKQGFLSAFLELDYTNANSDMTATDVLWARPYQDVQHYPFGWPEVIKLNLSGAKYTVPTVAENRSVVRTPDDTVAPADGDTLSDGLNAPNPSGNAKVDFFGPPFAAAELTKHVNISSTDLVTKIVTDANFTLTITRASGKFSGGFQRADLTKPTYQGIIYQKGSLAGGYGWFLTPVPAVKTYDGFSGPVELLGKP